MLGGYHDQAVDQEHTAFFHECLPHVNGKLGLTSAAGEWELLSVQTQVVAGTNFKYSARHKGKTYSIKIFRPLPHTGSPPEVTEAAEA
jgi:hypothetical protein